jgi:release factor glutamine methyltransferase
MMETDASRVENRSLGEALRAGAAQLLEAGVDSPNLDSEVLLRHVLGLERGELYVRLSKPMGVFEQERFQCLLDRRAAREPLAYITGTKEFWSLDFVVNPAVLIPRPETELLVELALACAEHRGARRLTILDVGTGSGAIAVSLAVHLPEAEVWALDISQAALRVAETNAARHGVAGRVRFRRGDLFGALAKTCLQFDLILSNPPYIRRAELARLAPEVRAWEPAEALDGGSGGVAFYSRIIGAAPAHLAPQGRVLLEIGSDQAETVVDLFARTGCFLPAASHRDYAGRDRVVSAATRDKGRG